jgi:hypothetical protein
MATRTVTGTLYHADGSTVWANAPVVITPKFAGSYESSGLTNASGVFTIVVPLPDSGNGTYVARFPGDNAVQFIMGIGSTSYDISGLIASVESVAPQSQSQTLTDGATVSWNTALGAFGIVTLGGSRTMAAPTNLVSRSCLPSEDYPGWNWQSGNHLEHGVQVGWWHGANVEHWGK